MGRAALDPAPFSRWHSGNRSLQTLVPETLFLPLKHFLLRQTRAHPLRAPGTAVLCFLLHGLTLVAPPSHGGRLCLA